MGPTPNLPRPLRNRALQTIIVLKKWQIRPRPLRVCVNIPAVAEREYQNPPASAPQPLRMCERSLTLTRSSVRSEGSCPNGEMAIKDHAYVRSQEIWDPFHEHCFIQMKWKFQVALV